jgi:hypothetical protein
MKFLTFEQYGSLNSAPIFSAFKQSVTGLGHELVTDIDQADVAVIWSVLWHGRMAANRQIFENFSKIGKPVVVLEVGSISRGTTWKVGVGGVNGSAQFNHKKNHNQQRFDQLGLKLSPWSTKKDGNIVICCQHSLSQQWSTMPRIDLWLETTVNEIRKFSDRNIVVRPHPRQAIPNVEKFLKIPKIRIETPKKLAGTYDDFDFDQTLASAYCVVNWSSNPAIQAVIKGIPVVTGPESLAYPVSQKLLKNIENLEFVERQQWANDFVYTEWTVDEIGQGLPLKQLLPILENVKNT